MADSALDPRTTDRFLAVPVRPDWPLRAQRLLLRPWVEGDFEAFFEMQRDQGVERAILDREWPAWQVDELPVRQ
jgi:hypothetical protein